MIERKLKPNIVAVIREAECIGCAKCLDACPVDAIIGSNQYMHTVIAAECVGCQLCVPPCPVDCIELISLPEIAEETREEKKKIAMQRFQARKQRLTHEEVQAEKKVTFDLSIAEKKSYIAAALAKAKERKQRATQ